MTQYDPDWKHAENTLNAAIGAAELGPDEDVFVSATDYDTGVTVTRTGTAAEERTLIAECHEELSRIRKEMGLE